MTRVKICGLSTDAAMEAAVENGADFVGLVFFDRSPRAVTPAQAAQLLDPVPAGVHAVGLFVDPTDDLLDTVLSQVRLDMLQLHGRESPERVEVISREFGMPVMKALPVSEPADLEQALAYRDAADWLLLDAKPPKDATRPGGNALRFDWSILNGFKAPLPWMLAGGITLDCLAEAARHGADCLDVSSGVESAPGQKDPARIKALLDAAAGL